MVVDHDLGLQSQLSHEAVGPSGVLGSEEDEGHPILPDWAAGTGYEPCAWTDRPAREESPFPGGIGAGTAAHQGA